MSGGKLIFSFSNGVNLAVNQEDLAETTIIKFGAGFEQLEMQYDDAALRLIGQDEVRGKKPAAEFMLKPEAPVGGAQAEHPAIVEPVDQIGSTAEVPLHVPEEVRLLNSPVAFHEGTTETKERKFTRTQRRNRNRRFRQKQDKIRRLTEQQRWAEVAEIADYTPGDVIPLVEEYVPQFVRPAQPRQIISEEELAEFQNVKKQNFEHFQRVKGKLVNILEGLELHTGVFSEGEQAEILNMIYEFRDKGRAGLLLPRTYSEPQKWMRGKGRITIQFGGCYNFTVDADGNPPGIIRHEDIDPLPPLLKYMIRKMVAWHVLPQEVVPDSCIVNIYEEGDCIPPHVDSHDFLRPFCTVSFLGECDILFGTDLRIAGPGEFLGPVRIPLPVGSVLILAGNGADLAKHCIPGVPRPRISATFRKMDPQKWPYNYQPEPDLQGLRPLTL